MKIHAYQEIYLNKVQSAFGDMFDYAVNVLNLSGQAFVSMFLVSPLCRRMDRGDVLLAVGKGGYELAVDVVNNAKGSNITPVSYENYSRSKEYWIGWTVACYQWITCRTFEEIFSAIPYSDLEGIYSPLHEADVSKFVEVAENRIKGSNPETNLKRFRSACSLSQSELSCLSGVSLRSIQMYEQRQKDINKANAETVFQLARVLGCEMESLLEK